jgi:tetratricopeptide (TPR) repeat protein
MNDATSARLSLALQLCDANKYQEAYPILLELHKAEPTNLTAQVSLAWCIYQAPQLGIITAPDLDPKSLLKNALAQRPSKKIATLAYYYLAMILKRDGKQSAAELSLGKALELSPDFEAASMELRLLRLKKRTAKDKI